MPRRLRAALLAAAVQLVLLAAIIFGLRVPFARPVQEAALKAFGLIPPPPPPPPPPPRKAEAPSRPKDEAAPANLRATATPVVAPPPLVRPPLPPPPVTAAEQPAEGRDASLGASDRPGPGTGAGGVGDGRGGGGEGEGTDTPPRLLRGRLRYGDLPDWLRDEERTVRMELRYTIEVDGRVSRCGADRSSGYPEVDALICRLIRERYRYRPALDEDGDPVRSTMIERQDFIAHPEGE